MANLTLLTLLLINILAVKFCYGSSIFDRKLDYDFANYMDYDDNGTVVYEEVPKQYTCIYDGQSLREDEQFKSGPDGCLHCICLNNEVNCKNVNCPYPFAAFATEVHNFRSHKQKNWINASALNNLIEIAETNIKNIGNIQYFEDMLNDMQSCEYKYFPHEYG